MERKRTFRSQSAKQIFIESLEKRQLMASGPMISEFVASNKTGILDADGSLQDWIEIYNPTASPADMTGWKLTDSPTGALVWNFPSMTLAAGERRVIFASDKNRTDPAGELHTNFKLSNDGEYLALFDATGNAASLFDPFPAQSADVSFGAPDSDLSALRFFSPPTPGAPNGEGLQTSVSNVTFSADRGFYDSPFALTLSSDTTGASIRYTLDGTEPSPTSGILYSGPITIDETSNVRAIAYKAGLISSYTDTRTYIFLDQVIRQPSEIEGWPNPGIPTANYLAQIRVHDYEMDQRVVNDPAYSGVIKKGLTDIPTMSLVLNQADMWDENGEGGFYRLEDVEKRVSVEIINPKNTSSNVQVNAGIESHSHDRMKRSMRLKFKSEFGASELVSSIMKDAPLNGDSASTRFDSLILRAGNQRSWARSPYTDKPVYTEDQWYRDTQLAMSGVGSRGNFVHLYINGIYWGLYNPVERTDDNFVAIHEGGDADDYFAVNESGPKDGDPTRWDYLRTTLKDKDMSVLSNYRELEQYLDTTNFVDYLLLEFYGKNTDWPHNNFWAVNRNLPTPGPTKFYMWDGEFSFGLNVTGDTRGQVHGDFRKDDTKNGTKDVANLFNSAKANKEFLTLLADRAFKHMFNTGELTDGKVLSRWNTLTNYIRDAVVAESARWGDILDDNNIRTRDVEWAAEEARIRNFFSGNAADLIQSLKDNGYYPKTSPASFSQRGGTVQAGYALTLTNPNSGGTIYYTIDGSDPRAVGGAVSSSAKAYSGSIAINGDSVVKLRVLRSGEWSALDEAAFITTGEPPPPPPPPVQGPKNGVPFTVGASPVTIQAEDYDLGGEGLAYHDLTAGNVGGQYRNDNVDIKPIAGASNQYRISDAQNGEWLEYTINVQSAGSYLLEFRVGNRDPGSTFHADLIGTGDLTGALAAPDTNSFDSFATVSKTVTLPVGQQVLRFAFDANAPASGYGAAFDWVKITKVVDDPGSTPVVVDLVLVDAMTDQDIAPLVEGQTIDLAQLGNQLSIRANVNGSPVSVRFNDNGTLTTENSAIWAIKGNDGNDYFPWTPPLGAHTLVVTPYSGSNGTGTAGTALTVHYNVISGNPGPGPVVLGTSTAAYVRDGTYSGTNFGSKSELVVKQGSNVGNTRYTYLKFDLTQLGATVRSATLRLNGRLSGSGSVQVDVLGSSDVGWSESGIKWSNKPEPDTQILSSKTLTSTSTQWYEWDVTSYLQELNSLGATSVTLILLGHAESSPYARFSSDEASSSVRPQLIVTP